MNRMMQISRVGWLAPLLLAAAAWAAGLNAPDQVKNSLRILAYVQNDMASKLPNKRYEMLPHENQEFQEAAVPMLKSVAGEPAEFRARVETQLKKAQAAANQVAEISKSGDAQRISAAVTAVDAALRPLYELFPQELRPVPGQLGSGPGRRGGPPPDLR